MICTWIAVQSYDRFVKERDQRVYRELAQTLARELTPALRAGLSTPAAERTARRIRAMNPALELYVLDEHGRLLADFTGPENIEREQISVEPIRAFLSSDERLPILGDDPQSWRGQEIFTAAPIRLGEDARGYLYVILRGAPLESVRKQIQDSYILQALAANLLITFAFTGLIGLILFAFLTRRFRRLTAAVRRFKAGNYGQRVEDDGEDEVSQLGRAFNEMAATIAAQVEALKRTDEARRELVANVSHDFRTPLTSTRAYVERLLMKGEALAPEERLDYLQAVLHNIEQLSHLAEQLSVLSELDARQVAPRFEPFSIAELVQDVVVKFRPEAEEHGVKLQAEYSPRLPQVYADISLIERVISNLIDNALHNTPEGGMVRLELVEQPSRVRVMVSDTGYGIAPEELPLVSQRFYRTAHSRAHGTGGSGLGLAIAHETLTLHGSTLDMQSEVGVGTTVSFSLRTDSPPMPKQSHAGGE